ncbi:hypothetical protein BN1708_005149 [Verticillium longisporum]|uniref:Uncharacterized protein n=1 Tax=Verticillium longisporum TaxID=100787 RepID=A0A0G4M881_VERLO|nr:hypothetical protein BN1708_005149 [Verticillium longisporum]
MSRSNRTREQGADLGLSAVRQRRSQQRAHGRSARAGQTATHHLLEKMAARGAGGYRDPDFLGQLLGLLGGAEECVDGGRGIEAFEDSIVEGPTQLALGSVRVGVDEEVHAGM